MENWKNVPGWSAYEVSDLGRVRRIGKAKGATPGKVKNPSSRKGGYQRVILTQEGRVRQVDVHILVAETFIGPRPDGCQAAHNDGDPRNCRLSNISWKTVSENDADKDRHGSRPKGSSHVLSILTEDQVREIRAAPRAFRVAQELADRFGVKPSTIRNIRSGKRKWRHV